MKKIMITLVLVMACAIGNLSAQPRGYRYHRSYYGEPRHSHYVPAPYHHGDFGAFLIGAAVGAVIDHAITKATTPRTVVIERPVAVDSYGYPIDETDRNGYPIDDYNRNGYPIDETDSNGYPIEAANGTVEAAPHKKVIVVEDDAPVVIVRKSAPVMIFDDFGFHFETHPLP